MNGRAQSEELDDTDSFICTVDVRQRLPSVVTVRRSVEIVIKDVV